MPIFFKWNLITKCCLWRFGVKLRHSIRAASGVRNFCNVESFMKIVLLPNFSDLACQTTRERMSNYIFPSLFKSSLRSVFSLTICPSLSLSMTSSVVFCFSSLTINYHCRWRPLLVSPSFCMSLYPSMLLRPPAADGVSTYPFSLHTPETTGGWLISLN